MFQLIDPEAWARREYFQHYFHEVPCFYSMTVKLDITRLRQSGERLYPALLYLLSTLVNRHEEFRMALDGQGRLGVYDQMHPSYTVFHPDSETFSNLWTEYRPAYPEFRAAFEADMAAYGQRPAQSPQQRLSGVHASLDRLRGLQPESPPGRRVSATHLYPGQIYAVKRTALSSAGGSGASCGLRRLSRLPFGQRASGTVVRLGPSILALAFPPSSTYPWRPSPKRIPAGRRGNHCALGKGGPPWQRWERWGV